MSNHLITVTWENDEGEERETALPASYVVCHRCEGKGTHVNPNVDGHGITQEEWESEWTTEEREDYFAGVYDVECSECKGKRVVSEIAEDEIKKSGTAEQRAALKAHHDQQREEHDYRSLVESEIRYGC